MQILSDVLGKAAACQGPARCNKGACKAGLAVYPGPGREPHLGGELGPALLLQLAQDGPLMVIAGALVKE